MAKFRKKYSYRTGRLRDRGNIDDVVGIYVLDFTTNYRDELFILRDRITRLTDVVQAVAAVLTPEQERLLAERLGYEEVLP